jgi:hypothetical protein
MSSPEKLLTVEEALNTGVSKVAPHKSWLALLTVFILAYYVPVLFWLFRDYPTPDESIPPPQFPFKGALEANCMKAMVFFGSVQCWSVFSPLVNHKVYHETAVITYEDGASKIYEFPRMSKKSYFERFKHEKLRKIFGDCIPWPGYENFLPSVSRYLALSNCNPQNQPAMLSFVFNVSENPKPDPKNWNYRDNLPWHSDKFVNFVYGVRNEDVTAQYQPNSDARKGKNRIYGQRFAPSEDETI